MDFSPPITAGNKKRSGQRSVANEEDKFELQDLSVKQKNDFKKYGRADGKVKATDENKDIKSASSFNRSDNDDNPYY